MSSGGAGGTFLNTATIAQVAQKQFSKISAFLAVTYPGDVVVHVEEVLCYLPSSTKEATVHANESGGSTIDEKKLKKRLLVATNYRLCIMKISRGTCKLLKDYPYFFLKEIKADEKNKSELTLTLEIPTSDFSSLPFLIFIKCEPADEKSLPPSNSTSLAVGTGGGFAGGGGSTILSHIYELYSKLTYAWPADITLQFKNIILPAVVDHDDTGICNSEAKARGLIQTYIAYCHLNGKQPKDPLMSYILSLGSNDNPCLKFEECPGIDGKSESAFELSPLAYALRHNNFIKSLEMRNLDDFSNNTSREPLYNLGIILGANRTVSKVIAVNCGEIPEGLGEALQVNPRHQIQILQLSGNKFTSRSLKSFTKGLMQFKHCCPVLDLSNSGIGSSGLSLLVDSFVVNLGMALGLEELNLSYNQANTQSFSKFTNFLSKAMRKSSLRRLALRNTGIPMHLLFPAISSISSLAFLDISENKFEKGSQILIDHLIKFAEESKSLRVINLSKTGMNGELLAEFLKKLFANQHLSELSIDISNNNLGPEGAEILVPVLKSAQGLHSLDLSDNGIREKASLSIVKNLPYSIRKFTYHRNVGEKLDTGEFAAALSGFLLSHPACTTLKIQGSTGFRMGKDISKLLAGLADNNTLTELDICGHQMGDQVFAEFCKKLGLNSNLKTLSCDNNNITMNGYLTFLHMLKTNNALQHLEFPEIDFRLAKAPGAATAGTAAEQFMMVLLQIQQILSPRQSDSHKHLQQDEFQFEQDWGIPLCPPPPPELKEIPSDLIEYINDCKKEIKENAYLEVMEGNIGSNNNIRRTNTNPTQNTTPVPPLVPTLSIPPAEDDEEKSTSQTNFNDSSDSYASITDADNDNKKHGWTGNTPEKHLIISLQKSDRIKTTRRERPTARNNLSEHRGGAKTLPFTEHEELSESLNILSEIRTSEARPERIIQPLEKTTEEVQPPSPLFSPSPSSSSSCCNNSIAYEDLFTKSNSTTTFGVITFTGELEILELETATEETAIITASDDTVPIIIENTVNSTENDLPSPIN